MEGSTWLRYNKAFHQAAAINPALRWDQQEPDIWLASLTGHSSTGLPPAQLPREQTLEPLLSSGPSLLLSLASGGIGVNAHPAPASTIMTVSFAMRWPIHLATAPPYAQLGGGQPPSHRQGDTQRSHSD